MYVRSVYGLLGLRVSVLALTSIYRSSYLVGAPVSRAAGMYVRSAKVCHLRVSALAPTNVYRSCYSAGLR